MKNLLLLIAFIPLILRGQNEINNVRQVEITKSSFQLTWTSTYKGTPAIQYGLTNKLELGLQKGIRIDNFNHFLKLTNLKPCTFYFARPLLINGKDTLFGKTGYYSTQSNSTGIINVMFNQGVDATYSSGTTPYISSGGSNIENEIISMINQATSSIDIAVYNNSRTAIVSALTNAYNNGIQIRYIANSGTSNYALNPAPSFPVFYVNPNEHMHNKFIIIDADSINSSWLWTGSMNWTFTDMYNNFNNCLLIQDQALALAYEMEFEEMWGSSSANYNATSSKVGSQKTNNTPHTFNIGGITVESYFSPSDNTTDEIESAILSADYDLEFCLFSFTRNELGTAVRNEHSSGVYEHGLMQNINDSGSEFNWLVSEGVNILADNHSYDLHHKYAIIDAGNSASDPKVVTGSHNWTTAAEEDNDENTLIIHDATITNLYLQEFTLRWCEVKNNINCTLPFTVASENKILTKEEILIFPTPSSNQATIILPNVAPSVFNAKLYNTKGQLITSFHFNSYQLEFNFDCSFLKNGIYFLILSNKDKTWHSPLSIIK